MKERIYVIEDDENISEIMNLALTSNGYVVELFDNAIDAIAAFEKVVPDLAIFDVMLPSMDGITAIKKLREQNIQIPILILSAKDREIDKVHGLDSGSDDYMTKPFGVLELSARVRTLLRRNKSLSSQIHTKTLFVDKQTRTIKKDTEVLDLTNKEYQLLLYLMENHYRIVEREELLQEIWGYDFVGESRAIDVHIRALRSKLDDDGTKYIKTIRSVGYRYIEEGGVHE
jgi:two-component system alkaline phosphatase synthesis response regulator PhoP